MLKVEIQEAVEEPENEANFTQVDVLLQWSAGTALVLLSDDNEWLHEPKHTAQGTGSGHVRLGSCRPCATINCCAVKAKADQQACDL